MVRWPGAALGLLATVVCVTIEASAQQLPTRANIDILIVADDQIAATRMNQWSNALISRLSKLSNDSSLGMKRPISVKPFPQKTFVGANALQTRWTQRRRIQIVEGEEFGSGVKDGGAEEIVDLAAERTGRNLSDPFEIILEPHIH